MPLPPPTRPTTRFPNLTRNVNTPMMVPQSFSPVVSSQASLLDMNLVDPNIITKLQAAENELANNAAAPNMQILIEVVEIFQHLTMIEESLFLATRIITILETLPVTPTNIGFLAQVTDLRGMAFALLGRTDESFTSSVMKKSLEDIAQHVQQLTGNG